MDVPLLRTMTWKSMMNFGKYQDLSVQQVFDLNHTAYLRWVYYNSSKITFIEEILDSLHISDQYRIVKPGTDAEMCEKLNAIKFNIMCKMYNPKHVMAKIANGSKIKAQNFRHEDRRTFSKGNLQRINHGH